jgi:hypothetical protein
MPSGRLRIAAAAVYFFASRSKVGITLSGLRLMESIPMPTRYGRR